MNKIQNNTQSTPAPDIEKEGEKVSGGEAAGNASTEDQNSASGDQQNDEYTPATETSKEEMTGYNELPEQEKVGGA